MKQKKCENCNKMFEYKSNSQYLCEKCKYEEKHYSPVRVGYTDRTINNNWSEMDVFEIGQVIELNGQEWTIQSITELRRKLYHCVNEIELKETFDCLDLRKGNLL